MLADSEILNLLQVNLETKELLPEFTGIYYVVDENNMVWYIGKAKNLYKRWQGKSHHRIYQLKQLKHKSFTIFYKKNSLSQLDSREKLQINKYNPHLNNSPVKNKKFRPTETLFRETINKISDFAFILGVEPPRREVKDRIGISRLIQEQLLDLPVVHICLDSVAFQSLFNPDSINEQEALFKTAFGTRKAYANKWEAFPEQYYLISRLIFNGYIIEVTYFSIWIGYKNIEINREYIQTEIAQESIRTLTAESLAEIKQYNLAHQKNTIRLQRLKPYTLDIIPLFFNESIDLQSNKEQLKKLSQDYKKGKRGLGSRSDNASLNLAIKELLISRGIDPDKYKKGEVRPRPMPGTDKIGLCIDYFGADLKKSRLIKFNDKVQTRLSIPAIGLIDDELTLVSSSELNTVYLLAGVKRKAWLLVEEYLHDFAKPSNKLQNGEGYVEKYFVSARKFIVPAKVNIKLEDLQYSVWIPFGMNERYPTFEAAKQEIKNRLNHADLSGLKLSFKKESITK